MFDDAGEVFLRTGPAERAELAAAARVLLASRESAMSNGLVLSGRRYEVHRHHPDHRLIVGRTMDGEPELSTGWALMWVDRGVAHRRTFCLITYEMPHVSAQMVAHLDEFMHVYVAKDRKRR